MTENNISTNNELVIGPLFSPSYNTNHFFPSSFHKRNFSGNSVRTRNECKRALTSPREQQRPLSPSISLSPRILSRQPGQLLNLLFASSNYFCAM